MSDIRVQNTKNNLIAALLSCLEDESFHKLKVKDIIDKAGVSTRTFYQYYSDVNDLLRDTEDSFITEYLKNVEKDHDSLGDLDLDTPFEDQLENILNATKNTIEFCYAHKKEIQVLLSDNGDTRFYNMIFQTGCEEIMKRMSQMKNIDKLKMNEKEQMRMMISVQVFVHSIIGMVRVLLEYSDRLAPYDVRQSIFTFLRESPVASMNINKK